MVSIFTVSFFGHRDFRSHNNCEKKLKNIVKYLINNKEYVDFLVGKEGEFDRFVSSIILSVKHEYFASNSFFYG